MDELTAAFSIDRVHKSGAKFDYEKARWFNQEWIKKSSAEYLLPLVKQVLTSKGIDINDEKHLLELIHLVKERCVLISDFFEQLVYFFQSPVTRDLESIQPKWNDAKHDFFTSFCQEAERMNEWDTAGIENLFKKLAEVKQIKPGELQLPMRIMLVGGKYGPAVFEIAHQIGKAATLSRTQHVPEQLKPQTCQAPSEYWLPKLVSTVTTAEPK